MKRLGMLSLATAVTAVAFGALSMVMQAAGYLFSTGAFELFTRAGMRLTVLTIIAGIMAIAALLIMFIVEAGDIWYWVYVLGLCGAAYEYPSLFEGTMLTSQLMHVLHAILFALLSFFAAMAIYHKLFNPGKTTGPQSS